jgi:hypothetical protein
MALLDRLVDGAIVMKVKGGESYREHRAKVPWTAQSIEPLQLKIDAAHASART